jgi:hypothetical protein
LFALLWHPSAAWVEHVYTNGFYAAWERAIQPPIAVFPWSLGDLAILAGIAAIVAIIVRAVQTRSFRPVLAVAAVAGLYCFWFEASWGWNYDRAPIEARVRYDPARVNPHALDALRARAIAQINALAPAAHANAALPLDRNALRDAWLGVVRAAGDTWDPSVDGSKPTIFDPVMQANGTSGFVNPLTLNVQLAGDLLWFERPFDLAHEWSHIAGFAREDEANYIAIVSCTRSTDPVLRYSGWLELFLYLPPLEHYAKRTFSPLVWSDFAAIRRRDARHLNRAFERLSLRTYNAYLKSNHIASGIQNYGEVARLYLGVPLDRRGLPKARPQVIINPTGGNGF